MFIHHGTIKISSEKIWKCYESNLGLQGPEASELSTVPRTPTEVFLNLLLMSVV